MVKRAIVAVCTLLVHGANYIAMKTENELQNRASDISKAANWGALIFSLAALISITILKTEVWSNYSKNLWGYAYPLIP